MKIVGPVVLEPWQREWESERAEIAKLIEKAKKTVSEAAKQRYFAFLERLVNFRVLDPACGSGNFLYLALRCLKDFEKRVIHRRRSSWVAAAHFPGGVQRPCWASRSIPMPRSCTGHHLDR